MLIRCQRDFSGNNIALERIYRMEDIQEFWVYGTYTYYHPSVCEDECHECHPVHGTYGLTLKEALDLMWDSIPTDNLNQRGRGYPNPYIRNERPRATITTRWKREQPAWVKNALSGSR